MTPPTGPQLSLQEVRDVRNLDAAEVHSSAVRGSVAWAPADVSRTHRRRGKNTLRTSARKCASWLRRARSTPPSFRRPSGAQIAPGSVVFGCRLRWHAEPRSPKKAVRPEAQPELTWGIQTP